ncbi:MAG: hypothetical protein AAF645_17650, partial [Myxococcota bacterium]
GSGLLSTALHLEWFTRVFDVQFGVDNTEQGTFREVAQMPKPPGFLLTQDDVDVLLTWAERGAPGIRARIDESGGVACTDEVRRGMIEHVDAMATEGWTALNIEDDVTMFGCAGAEDASECLAAFPSVTTLDDGARWEEGVTGEMRVLFEYGYRSSFWTRSSADGRYVGHGGGERSNATFIDLERGELIPSAGQYDPGFFPDNSGFVMQSAGFCPQSILDAEPSQVTFRELGCSDLDSVGLYQHMAAVRGGDYWTVFGQFVSDDGGFGAGRALPVDFDNNSEATFVPIVYDGRRYEARAAIDVQMPFEGDTVISPSSRLAVSRTRGPEGGQSGFAVREIIASPRGETYRIESPTVATYCVRGSKPFFSYDEEWMVYHRYVLDDDAVELGFTGADDPDFAAYRTQGAANTYMLHLPTGEEHRLTFAEPGQYALFPHFRSDGWVYIVMRDSRGGSTTEYIVASDAYFRL